MIALAFSILTCLIAALKLHVKGSYQVTRNRSCQGDISIADRRLELEMRSLSTPMSPIAHTDRSQSFVNTCSVKSARKESRLSEPLPPCPTESESRGSLKGNRMSVGLQAEAKCRHLGCDDEKHSLKLHHPQRTFSISSDVYCTIDDLDDTCNQIDGRPTTEELHSRPAIPFVTPCNERSSHKTKGDCEPPLDAPMANRQVSEAHYPAELKCKLGPVDNEPGHVVDEETENSDISVSSDDLYYTLENINGDYQRYDQTSTHELPSYLASPTPNTGNERQITTTVTTCGLSQNEYMAIKPDACPEVRQTTPVTFPESTATGFTNDVTDSVYNKLKRPPFEDHKLCDKLEG